jgi:signal transduction protein with GAF and PtsI domain
MGVGSQSESSLLGALEEVSRLVVSHRGDASETLANIARLMQRRFQSDVCSIYLLEPDRLHLKLAATIGLDPASIGRVRMPLTEGLVGLVGEQLAPQVFADATTHPRFKYFPEANEDRYQSFLGVPMVDRGLLLGVLVVQTIDAREFSEDEIRMAATAASQVAPIVSDARVLHEAQLQAERLRVVHMTMRTVQDIVNNCLNQLQLLRLDAEGRVPEESLDLFDHAISTAAAELRALGNLEEFSETRMEIGAALSGAGAGPRRGRSTAA